jgi:hypothetical protein
MKYILLGMLLSCSVNVLAQDLTTNLPEGYVIINKDKISSFLLNQAVVSSVESDSKELAINHEIRASAASPTTVRYIFDVKSPYNLREIQTIIYKPQFDEHIGYVVSPSNKKTMCNLNSTETCFLENNFLSYPEYSIELNECLGSTINYKLSDKNNIEVRNCRNEITTVIFKKTAWSFAKKFIMPLKEGENLRLYICPLLTKATYILSDCDSIENLDFNDYVKGELIVEKAYLHRRKAKTFNTLNMYLVEGDQFWILNEFNDKNGIKWYQIQFESKNKEDTIKWIMASSVKNITSIAPNRFKRSSIAQIGEKTFLYSSPTRKAKTKMYLITGDFVKIKSEKVDSDGIKWLNIIYEREGKPNINKWLLSDSITTKTRDLPKIYDKSLSYILLEKTYLYDRPDNSAITKMYLIKEDIVKVFDQKTDVNNNVWLQVIFERKGKKDIIKWLPASSVEIFYG